MFQTTQPEPRAVVIESRFQHQWRPLFAIFKRCRRKQTQVHYPSCISISSIFVKIILQAQKRHCVQITSCQRRESQSGPDKSELGYSKNITFSLGRRMLLERSLMKRNNAPEWRTRLKPLIERSTVWRRLLEFSQETKS